MKFKKQIKVENTENQKNQEKNEKVEKGKIIENMGGGKERWEKQDKEDTEAGMYKKLKDNKRSRKRR